MIAHKVGNRHRVVRRVGGLEAFLRQPKIDTDVGLVVFEDECLRRIGATKIYNRPVLGDDRREREIDIGEAEERAVDIAYFLPQHPVDLVLR